MGHIKEPKGVDFVIKSAPLTEKARQQISEFISDYKSKTTSKKSATAKKDKVFQD
jgi:hypothetical protein